MVPDSLKSLGKPIPALGIKKPHKKRKIKSKLIYCNFHTLECVKIIFMSSLDSHRAVSISSLFPTWFNLFVFFFVSFRFVFLPVMNGPPYSSGQVIKLLSLISSGFFCLRTTFLRRCFASVSSTMLKMWNSRSMHSSDAAQQTGWGGSGVLPLEEKKISLFK